MRRVVAGLIAACLISIIIASGAKALTVTPTPLDKAPAPLMITAYQVTGPNLNLIQVYNSSHYLVDLANWRVNLDYTDANSHNAFKSVALSGWLEPGKHLLAEDDQQVIDGPVAITFGSFGLDDSLSAVQVNLIANDGKYQTVNQPIDDVSSNLMMRSLTGSGNYSSSTNFVQWEEQAGRPIFSDPLYQLPNAPVFKIVEILANSADCAPNDTSLVCGDYVKLYNPTSQPLDLSQYSLRTDSSGENSSVSNTVWLGAYQPIKPQSYTTIYLRDDQQDLSLTNSGGYVWITDTYGVKRYDSTITKYADAGSSQYKGWSWALNRVTAKWQWTSTPKPDQANHFELPKPSAKITESRPLQPCASNQFRNPVTNRCKLKASVTSQLTPCAPNQVRNPATNRCKLKLSSSPGYVACKAGQQRNPATNRCRAVLAAHTTYVPCDPGEERNPATHRCRQTGTNPAAQVGTVSPEQIIQQSDSADYGNVILAGTGAVVVGYGLFEWRKELFDLGRKAFAIFGHK